MVILKVCLKRTLVAVNGVERGAAARNRGPSSRPDHQASEVSLHGTGHQTGAWPPRATTFIIQRQQDLVLLQAFLISIFCCFFPTSAGFGKWMCNTPLSNFASTFAGSGSNGRGIARLNEP